MIMVLRGRLKRSRFEAEEISFSQIMNIQELVDGYIILIKLVPYTAFFEPNVDLASTFTIGLYWS